MKKAKKVTALIISLLMICLCFSGCDSLNELRKHHATFTTTGDYNSITYKGEVYKRIDNLSTTLPDPFYNINEADYVYVTEPGTPVLLAEDKGVLLEISSDENFIKGDITYYPGTTKNILNEEIYIEYGPECLYCKADIYDDVKSQIETGIDYTLYGYGYYDNLGYEAPENYKFGVGNYEAEYKFYYLTDDEIEALNDAIGALEPVDYDLSDYKIDYIVAIYAVSDDKLFGESVINVSMDHLGRYILSFDRPHFPGIDDEEQYYVPESYTKTFREITRTAVTREHYMDDFYYYYQ